MMLKGMYVAAAVGALMISSAVAYGQTAATPTATPDAAPQATQQPGAPAEDPNEVVCKAGAPIVGSRFSTGRTCHSRKEWDQIRKDSQDTLYHQQMERSSTGPSSGTGH
jgi:hypothetical protein